MKGRPRLSAPSHAGCRVGAGAGSAPAGLRNRGPRVHRGAQGSSPGVHFPKRLRMAVGAGQQHPRGRKDESPLSEVLRATGQGTMSRRHSRHIRRRWTLEKGRARRTLIVRRKEVAVQPQREGTAGAKAQVTAGDQRGQRGVSMRIVLRGAPKPGQGARWGPSVLSPRRTPRGTCRGAAGGMTGARHMWQGSQTLGGTDEGTGAGTGATATGEGP